MKVILLVSATSQETDPLVQRLDRLEDELYNISDNVRLRRLICGVGMLPAAVRIAGHLAHNSYEMALMAGIAGCFHNSVPLGSVLRIISDQMPELGAEAGDEFIPIEKMGLIDLNSTPWQQGVLPELTPEDLSWFPNIPRVKGITVNTVHGNEKNIRSLVARLSPDVESMEGAAMHFACIEAGQQFLHIRSVSNYVVKRDRNDWNIPLALEKLNDFLYASLMEYSDNNK